MTMYSVEILNPKAIRLLEDLADLDLIKLQPKTPMMPKQPMSDEDRASLRERVMRGAPSLHVDEMIGWLNESKADRPLPFRDEE